MIQKTKRAERGLCAIQESGSWLSVLCLQSLGLYNILPSLPNRTLQTALSFTPLSSKISTLLLSWVCLYCDGFEQVLFSSETFYLSC